MSSRVTATPANLPTSATVLDFTCLFTHDLKRKQKRWQDGKLKFHTFNKKVMVYDDGNHFIGDAHWQEDGDLQEGDEFSLDRGSAIVQVSECTGYREQDLTELLDKRARDVEKRRANATTRTPRPTTAISVPARQDQPSALHPRNRPLSSMLGTPSRIGRAAIPQRSPFEARQIAQSDNPGEQKEGPRPAKRRRLEDSPFQKPSHARSLFGEKLTLSAVPVSTPVSRSQALRDETNSEEEALPTSENSIAKTTNKKPSAKSLKTVPERSRQESPKSSDEVICLSSPPVPEIPDLPAKVQRQPRLQVSRARPNHQRDVSVEIQEDTAMGSLNHAVPLRPPLEEVLSNEVTTHLEKSKAAQAPQKDSSPPRKVQKKTKAPPKTRKKAPEPKGKTGDPESEKPVVDRVVARKASPPKTEGPRTELRIKSRQRRGLLMMTEKVVRSPSVEVERSEKQFDIPASSPMFVPQSPPNQPEKLGFNIQIAETVASPPKPLAVPESPPKMANKQRTVSLGADDDDEGPNGLTALAPIDRVFSPLLQPNDTYLPASAQVPVETVSDDDQPVTSRNLRPRRRIQNSRPKVKPVSSDSDSDASLSEPPVPSRQKKARAVDTQKASSAPRITRMARKSVKSREILGFVVPSDDHVFNPPTALARSISKETKGPSHSVTEKQLELHMEEADAITQPTKAPEVVSSIANKEVVDKSESQPKPKLSNPATRGRKAARKEDAAGKLPQTIVQLEPVAPQLPKITKTLPPQERTGELPGFAKANGGAWSRHAEDLLGMSRPADRPARRR